MLRFLSYRENGTQDPWSLLRAEATRRAFSLEVSKYQDIQRVHSAGINSLSADAVEGRYLLSGAANGLIALHDLYNSTGEPKCTYQTVCSVDRTHKDGHKYSVETVQWYPLDTGMFMSSGMDKLLKIWDTNTLKTADEFQFSGNIYSHDMSQVALKHCLIAVASQSSKVRLVDLKSGSATHTLRGHKKPVISVKWSPSEENLLASGSEDNTVMLWDIRSSKGSLRMLDQHNGDTAAGPNSISTAHNGNINGLCFTRDGLFLLTFGTDERLRLWNTSTGKNTLVNYGRINNESRKGIGFSVSHNTCPDLVFVPADSDIEVFDIFSGEKLNTLRGHYNQVNCCVFDSNYQEIFSGGNDRNILIWTPETSNVTSWDNHLKEQDKPDKNKVNFVKRVGATDDWSSDDDN